MAEPKRCAICEELKAEEMRFVHGFVCRGCDEAAAPCGQAARVAEETTGLRGSRTGAARLPEAPPGYAIKRVNAPSPFLCAGGCGKAINDKDLVFVPLASGRLVCVECMRKSVDQDGHPEALPTGVPVKDEPVLGQLPADTSKKCSACRRKFQTSDAMYSLDGGSVWYHAACIRAAVEPGKVYTAAAKPPWFRRWAEEIREFARKWRNLKK